jgi:hypothetical protein
VREFSPVIILYDLNAQRLNYRRWIEKGFFNFSPMSKRELLSIYRLDNGKNGTNVKPIRQTILPEDEPGFFTYNRFEGG